MIDAACMRTDAWLTAHWTLYQPRFLADLHASRFVLALAVVAFSILDLLLTQSILTMVEGRAGVQPGEANALMAPVVMTWFAWPIRVGIPIIAVVRDLVQRNYLLMWTGFLLYGVVVAWNTHMFMIVSSAIN